MNKEDEDAIATTFNGEENVPVTETDEINIENTIKFVKIKKVLKKVYSVAKTILKYITVLPVVIKYAKTLMEKGD